MFAKPKPSEEAQRARRWWHRTRHCEPDLHTRRSTGRWYDPSMRHAPRIAWLALLTACGATPAPPTPSAPPPPIAVARIASEGGALRVPSDWIEEWPALSRQVASMPALDLHERWEADEEGAPRHCYEAWFAVPGIVVMGHAMAPTDDEPDERPTPGDREAIAALLAEVVAAGAPPDAHPPLGEDPVHSRFETGPSGPGVAWSVCFSIEPEDAAPRERRFLEELPALEVFGDAFDELPTLRSAEYHRTTGGEEAQAVFDGDADARPAVEAALRRAGFTPPRSGDCPENPTFTYARDEEELYAMGGWACRGVFSFVITRRLERDP